LPQLEVSSARRLRQWAESPAVSRRSLGGGSRPWKLKPKQDSQDGCAARSQRFADINNRSRHHPETGENVPGQAFLACSTISGVARGICILESRVAGVHIPAPRLGRLQVSLLSRLSFQFLSRSPLQEKIGLRLPDGGISTSSFGRVGEPCLQSFRQRA
jgi:hypothetical protein